MENKLAFIMIAVGASLWGIIGFFVTYLNVVGFTPTQIVAIRALSASFFLVLYVLIMNRSLFKINVADSSYFIGTGIFSIVLFNWFLFSAIEETSITIASILLYTAPAFVTILSRILFKEFLTPRKMIALFITLVGCSFVIGVFPNNEESISLYGFILGIGSGFFYALYSIFGKFALKKYNSLTVTVYTFLFAAIAITPFSGIWSVLYLFTDLKVWMYVIGLGFLSTVLPYLFYTKGLNTVESSTASIIATIEPVVASLIGFLLFREQLVLWQYIGIVFVITAVIVVQEKPRNTNKNKKNIKQEVTS
ncbi:drug/metabolite transporter (DMT)-like permease [Bacillus mesophilus]|uniref:EamA family transporter n=1 Tax=Bacillus mesophilus TaxID=1808955 RepID=A0A6M0QD40_9BACI|nr:DMT family transporter [Bacillus mesophilus]MBM7663464.1 drug/metabolite transporter (DMT)-like permease [Bacillus mesophilus]NEY74185.1 EamA family transporter [Bacillus mesophilus]